MTEDIYIRLWGADNTRGCIGLPITILSMPALSTTSTSMSKCSIPHIRQRLAEEEKWLARSEGTILAVWKALNALPASDTLSCLVFEGVLNREYA